MGAAAAKYKKNRIYLPVKHNVVDENVKIQTEVTYVLNTYLLPL